MAADGYVDTFLVVENALELNSYMVAQLCEYVKKNPNCSLRNGKFLVYKLYLHMEKT